MIINAQIWVNEVEPANKNLLWLQLGLDRTKTQLRYWDMQGWQIISTGSGSGGTVTYNPNTGELLADGSVIFKVDDFATKEYVDALIGDINAILDEINGEVI